MNIYEPSERQNDIIKLIRKLDLSPTQYQNAVSKYQRIAKYLESNGIEAEIYPQGSFSLGTVIRPVSKSTDASYDLDFVCQLRKTRDQQSAAELRKEVEEILTKSDLYEGKLEISDKCITARYADIDGVSFSIDIVPAADETEENKKRLSQKCFKPNLIKTAIAIPKHCNVNYNWITNNPRGYREWFEEINQPFLIACEKRQRQMIIEANSNMFSTIEEIPNDLLRSSVQRVIQILKYHRDVYYSSFVDGEDTKPISAIIGTIVAKVAQTQSPTLSVFELLNCVLDEITTYSNYQFVTEKVFLERYPDNRLISRKGNKWFMENPANPEDNLTDQWNENPNVPKRFFLWIKAAQNDLISSVNLNESEFRATMETAFGSNLISSVWGKKYCPIPSTSVSSTNVAKPWKKI